MNRVAWFIICTVVGLLLIAWGLLVPTHIRAVDANVLQLTGTAGRSLVSEGLSLVHLEKVGPARMLLAVAEQTQAPGHEKLGAAIKNFEDAQPRLRIWGGAALYLERIFEKNAPTSRLESRPVVDLLVGDEAREKVVGVLRHSRRPGVLEILATRELTNTTIFPPAQSSSGQPLDAVILTTALLFQQDHLVSGLRDSIQALASIANRGGEVEDLELVYLDLLGLGKRLDWVQLVTFMRQVHDTNALREAAQLVRDREPELPAIYSAVHMTDSLMPVVKYLATFPSTGHKDLSFALRAGSTAVRTLLERKQPVYYPAVRERFVAFGPIRAIYQPLARLAADHSFLGFSIKYGLCLVGALLIARAVTYLSPALVEEILATRPVVTGPQVALGLCLLSLVLFFSESLVTRAAPATPRPPVQIKFPVVSIPLRATIPHQSRAMNIDKFSAAALLTFFIAQAIIYVFCRMKLAEIHRQELPSRLKLRLLENEEHLFDAGLYFGFVGTVLSLVLVTMGIVKPSLMAAYSSTSFGIIFVSIVKIFHLRPFRRRLIMDVELAEREVEPA